MLLAVPTAFAHLDSLTSLPEPDGDLTLSGRRAREYLAAVRTEIRQGHDDGAGGIALVQAYTEAMDRLVAFLFSNATLEFKQRNLHINYRCTVVAQGGYGRGELNMFSDIDLLFLYPWKITPYVETVVDGVLVPLIDAGLDVGWATRNVRECARQAARDLKVKTSLLDVRYLCGDAMLFGELEERITAETWAQNPVHFFKEKLAFKIDRHAKFGDSIYLLQPNLKEGPGGLRDLHTALWVAKVKYKVKNFRDLVPLGVVTEADLDELQTAVDFLWRLRNAMHLESKSHQDHLTYELQYKVAPALGFGEGRPGVEALMRAYYQHAKASDRVSEIIIADCVQPPEPARGTQRRRRVIRPGMQIVGRTLMVTDREIFRDDPSTLVSVFAEAQRHGVTLSPPTQELIRAERALAVQHFAEPAVTERLREILQARGHVYETLAEMHRLGILTAVLPEFKNLECLISHDPFHVYTVDHHSLMGVRELDRLRAGEFSDLVPHLTQVAKEVPQAELVFMGMLLHDIGKGHGHDHDARGAEMAVEIAARLGLNEDERAGLQFLVRHHILMSHLAQRRDIGDEELIIDFCRTVGSLDNLQRLYLLTFADMRAVGPDIWNNWRGALVTELYKRARECFETDTYRADDRAERASRVRQRVVAAAPESRRKAVQAFAGTLPDTYFLNTPEDLIAAEAELRDRLATDEAGSPGQPAVALSVSHYPDWGYSEIAICCRDRVGLFATLSGVLAARGMNILGARITTTSDGVALDAFRISHQNLDPSEDEARWELVDRTIRRALSGEEDIEQSVARRRGSGLFRRARKSGPTLVEVHQDWLQRHTIIEVYSSDRVGLLFTITSTLARLGLQIHVAKITTLVDQVLDVFYVTGADGLKIEGEEAEQRIRTAIIAALDEEVAVSAPAA